MSTPAIDNIAFQSGKLRRCTYYGSTPSCSDSVQPQSGYTSELRPESVSIPFRDDGWRECGPWSHNGVTGRVSGGFIAYNDHGFRTEVSGDIFSYSDLVRVREVSVNTRNGAYTKALANAAENKIQLALFMAEIDKTAKMIAKNLISIALSVRRFRKRFPRLWKQVTAAQNRYTEVDWSYATSKKRRCKTCKKIPSAWLELQYGWKPLMSDIMGGINYLARLSQNSAPVVIAEGKFTDRYDATIRLQPVGWGSVPLPPIVVRLRESAYCKLYFSIADAKLKSSSELGLINPISVVWELLPYSFVVDWAAPIGTWIEAINAPSGLKFLDGCTSLKVVSEKSWIAPLPGGGAEVFRYVPPDLTHHEEHFRRIRNTLTVPEPYVKSPLSLQHVLNAMALLSQVFR